MSNFKILTMSFLTTVSVMGTAFAMDFVDMPNYNPNNGYHAQLLGKEAEDYNLQLIYMDQTGEYLSNVDVSIFNKDGVKILDNENIVEPVFLTKLNDGSYTIVSKSGDVIETQKIVVSQDLTTYEILMPTQGSEQQTYWKDVIQPQTVAQNM